MVYDQKTKPTEIDPISWINALEHKTRRTDALVLLDMLEDITGLKPRLWGASIIGYGIYHYRYDSGHAGQHFMTGFAPRKANMVVYIMPGYRHLAEPLGRLGKHRLGKACLYINKLADVDLGVLREIVTDGYEEMVQQYGPGNS